MTNNELNQYIKHYIEKDKTGRAIMLTGSWGIGKSYYIKNELIPFLEENGGYQCIVVSLYGLSSLYEVSNAIFLENWAKRFNFRSKTGKASLLIAKTVLNSFAEQIKIKTSKKDLQALYLSVDFSKKLIIIEDVERTQIDILELLGYVNILCEQDAVKVLLITNEKEIIQYKPILKKESQKDNASGRSDRLTQSQKKDEVKEYSEKTLRYLETKEKTISDTIHFTGDLKTAVQTIISSFDGTGLQRFSTEQDATNIVEILYLIRNKNLRSLIFACQKTSDILEGIPDEHYSEDFLKTVFYGIVAFSLRLHAGADNMWIGVEQYSQELGLRNYPLFRFCYDYILTQQLDISLVPVAASSLEKMRLYDDYKSSHDEDLQKLYTYHVLTEEDVRKCVKNITLRLEKPDAISFHEYAKIAVFLIKAKHRLEIDIDDAKELLVNNLRGRGDNITIDDLFWYNMGDESQEEQEEFFSLRQRMIDVLSDNKGFMPELDYKPDQSAEFYEYVSQNIAVIYANRGFVRYLDTTKLVEMFENCTAAQMNSIRGAFNDVYRPANIRQTLSEDLPAIEELLKGIIKAKESAKEAKVVDKVQLLQYEWFIDCLSEIKNKLSAE